jgi:hypothetical protein
VRRIRTLFSKRVDNVKRYILFFFMASLTFGCGSTNDKLMIHSTPPTPSSASKTQVDTWIGAVKIDPATGKPQTCTGPDDPTCNAEGPGELLRCDADLLCHLYRADDGCAYPGLAGGSMSCPVTVCGNDLDCDDGLANTSDTCVFTEASLESDPGGVCFHPYDTCVALESTPCEESGVTFCKDGNCACTVDGDLTKATTELCDEVDNDCDGQVDEDFNLGDACDSGDSDQCQNGTFTCAADQLGTECVNEAPKEIVESCNGADDNCDGQTDENFPTLGDDCDGDDPDQCQNGMLVCTLEGDGVTCDEVGKNVNELCNGVDDNCDDNVDEGCDDDGDGWCDPDMLVGSGATCASGDCDDEDEDVHPGATEFCNGVDDNCDAVKDEGFGLGDSCADGLGVCKVTGTFNKCAEDGLSAVCSAQEDPSQQLDTEVCNGLDDTCDGVTDEGCDDDGDGWCDPNMPSSIDATCDPGDCDDTDAETNPDAVETCDGEDDNCDTAIDEGCDDDEDGWCDSEMTVYEVGATCASGDCDDTNLDINPGMEEQCITAIDDNCDGDTDHLADGETPACDSCANALVLTCGDEHEIDMAAEPNATNTIEVYQCWTGVGPKQLKTMFSAPEVVVVPDASPGTQFSLQILTKGTGTIAARLHGSCEPDAGSAVKAFNEEAGLDGTCAGYGAVSVGGGIVGEDFIVLDAASAQIVKVKFTCVAPD